MSVILTYRSTGDTILEAVDSVLRQSYRTLELLLIDDNDAEREQISQLRGRFDDPRIRFIKNPTCGRVRALNLGVELARYGFCAIIDDDDLWHPDKLKWDVAVLQRGEADLVCCPEILFRDTVTFPEFSIPPVFKEVSVNRMLVKNRVVHPAFVCRKGILSYDPNYPVAHDYEFCLRILHQGRKIYKSDQPMVGVRVHNSNFNRPQSWLDELRHYVLSARMQAKYIVRFGRYAFLIFPLARVVYTLVRRGVKTLQVTRRRAGALRWRQT